MFYSTSSIYVIKPTRQTGYFGLTSIRPIVNSVASGEQTTPNFHPCFTKELSPKSVQDPRYGMYYSYESRVDYIHFLRIFWEWNRGSYTTVTSFFCILMQSATSFLKSKNFQLFVRKNFSLLYPAPIGTFLQPDQQHKITCVDKKWVK